MNEFTPNQIDELINIANKYQINFIAKEIGVDVLTKKDKKILKENNIDISKYSKEGRIDHAFAFGILSEALGDKRVSEMSYDQLKKFIKSGKFIPLNDVERSALHSVKMRSYSDIKGLGNKILQGINTILITYDQKRRDWYEGVIKNKTKEAIKNRESSKWLVSEIGEATKDWTRNLDRIVNYVLHEAYSNGRVASMIKNSSNIENIEVFFLVNKNACPICKSLYLYPNTQPKVFKLQTILNNGTNIGRKQKDWLPTTPPVHPNSITLGSTPILTDKGWIQIQNIEIGNYVMTHKGRFRKVLATIKNYKIPKDYPIKKQYWVKFKTDSSKKENKEQIVRLTAEHKILTDRGWIEIQYLNIEDKLIKILKPCLNNECDNYIDYCYDNKEYCCENCHNKQKSIRCNKQWENNSIVTEEGRESIREKVSENWKNGLHESILKYTQSNIARKKNSEMLLKDGKCIDMLNKSRGYHITKPQISLFKKVKLLYPKAELEYKFYTKSFDIAIPELKIDIEYDGIFWHKEEYQIERDKKRDEFVKSKDWHVLRYNKIPLLSNLKKDIERVACNSLGKYKFEEINIVNIEIHDLIVGSTKLFDIQVEEDESFIAKGIVIHNCFCQIQQKREGYKYNPISKTFTTPVKSKRDILSEHGVQIKVTVGNK